MLHPSVPLAQPLHSMGPRTLLLRRLCLLLQMLGCLRVGLPSLQSALRPSRLLNCQQLHRWLQAGTRKLRLIRLHTVVLASNNAVQVKVKVARLNLHWIQVQPSSGSGDTALQKTGAVQKQAPHRGQIQHALLDSFCTRRLMILTTQLFWGHRQQGLAWVVPKAFPRSVATSTGPSHTPA